MKYCECFYSNTLPCVRGNTGGRSPDLTFVQAGTLTNGLILMFEDVVLSNTLWILLTRLFKLDSFFSGSMADAAAMELEEEEVELDEEDAEREEWGLFFLSLNSSFHRTVHFGGRGEGSSSRNQLGSDMRMLLLLLCCFISFWCWWCSFVWMLSRSIWWIVFQ